MSRFVFVAAAVVTLMLPGLAQAADAWSYQSPRDVKHIALTPLGHLLVGTSEAIMLLDGTTGKVLWTLDAVRDCSFNVELGETMCRAGHDGGAVLRVSDDAPYAWVSLKSGVVVVDLQEGKVTLDSRSLPFKKYKNAQLVFEQDRVLVYAEEAEGRHVFAGFQASTGAKAWQTETAIVSDYTPLGLRNGRLFGYGKDRHAKRVLASIDPVGGGLWARDDVLTRDLSNYRLPLPDTDATVVVHLGKDGPIRLDSQGQVLWRARRFEGKDPLNKVTDPDVWVRDGSVIYLPNQKSVYAINTGDGTVLWEHKSSSEPTRLWTLSTSLLVSADGKLSLVDKKSGARIWRDEVVVPGAGWFRVDEARNRVFALGDKKLSSIDLASGNVTALGTYTIDHDNLDLTPEGELVATSRRHVTRFDASGKQRFHREYESPIGDGFWSNFGRLALASALSSIGPSIGSAAGVYVPGPTLATTMKFVANRRAQMAEATAQYHFVLFKQEVIGAEPTYGVARVSLVNGDERGTVSLKEKDPWIVLDAATQTLFYVDEKRSIRAMRFE